MTDRYNAFIVVLEKDIRDDDAEATVNAIRQIRGVLDVQPHLADPNESIAEVRVRREFLSKIYQLFDILETLEFQGLFLCLLTNTLFLCYTSHT